MIEWSLFAESWSAYAGGLWLTLKLTVLSLAAGLVLAIPLAVLRVSPSRWVSGPVWAYSYFFRGTPMLVQLLLMYYGLGQFEWIQAQWDAGNAFWLVFRDPYGCALITFALNTGAYTTEIIAGALRAMPHGEIEAARACGMSRYTMLRRILLPGALRRALPAYSNEIIFMLHGTAIASTVTLVDLTGAARNAYSQFFAPFEAFIFAGLIYLCITFALVGLFRVAERRWLAHLRPRTTTRKAA
ncbi:lysine/arginine/ornithine ABC transporter/histidine ABC transporter, membrane subunit HisM [Thauera humireducens]|uniref:ABC transporter permease n=1 Tax=Thauera humireducens TaxID=1134435 RepID=UPI002467A2E2|nr:ABC transporter permease [Thauera humireducens]CAH1748470.1 lysine/arginine/ornithine ABC transporter/histidine ABC transporter, membrane subunit HisM [Thauera humireducens]